MADNKKYYYLKLKENFFESEEIKILESMDNGYKYSNLLLKLYLTSLKSEGRLRLNEFIPYNEKMIAAVTNFDIDTVKVALEIFKKLGLIELLSDGTIFMLHIQKFIGKSSTEADRKREYRRRIDTEKLLASGQMSQNCPQDVETILDEHSREREIRDRDRVRDRTREREEEKKCLSVKENELIEICKHYEAAGFGTINLIVKEKLESLIEIYSKEWVKDAIETSVFRGRYKLSYVEGILQNWKAEGKDKKKRGVKHGNGSEHTKDELKEQGIGL